MTDREYVIRACQLKGLTLHKPTRQCRDILVMNWQKKDNKEFGTFVAGSTSWGEVKEQINQHFKI